MYMRGSVSCRVLIWSWCSSDYLNLWTIPSKQLASTGSLLLLALVISAQLNSAMRRPSQENRPLPPGEGTPIYTGHVGTCHGIGYGFWGSRSLKRVFFNPVFAVFLVWSLDQVAKLHYVILKCEKCATSLTWMSIIHPMLQQWNEVFLFMLLIFFFLEYGVTWAFKMVSVFASLVLK